MDYSHCLFAAFAATLPHSKLCKPLFLLCIAAFAAFASYPRYVCMRTYTHTRARTHICIYYRQMGQMRQNHIQVLDNIKESFCRTFEAVRQMRQMAFYSCEKRGVSWI